MEAGKQEIIDYYLEEENRLLNQLQFVEKQLTRLLGSTIEEVIFERRLTVVPTPDDVA